jgi:UDP-glucose 4-epimerase
MNAHRFASFEGDAAITQARAIVYFPWVSVPATFVDEPWREVSGNVVPAFQFFLRIAKLSPNTKIVLLSSGGTVYGAGGNKPKAETSPTMPISPYGLGKLMAEEALRFVGRTTGCRFAILRVSNAIGRWQASDTQGIVGVTLRAARDGFPVRLFGAGDQVRDFVDADDVAEAIFAASVDTAHHSATWNVGSGKGIAIRDLIWQISHVIGRPIEIEQAPPRGVDVPYVVLDCRKIASELGWKSKTPLEESILRLWQEVSGSSAITPNALP